MITYKKNILKTSVFQFCASLYAIVFIAFLITGNQDNMSMYLYILLGIIIYTAILGTACNYLIFTDNHFIVKNTVYPFLTTSFLYTDIRKIEFTNTPRGGIYLQIYTHHSEKVKRPTIECVKRTDLCEIAKRLKDKGIKIEITGSLTKYHMIEKEGTHEN